MTDNIRNLHTMFFIGHFVRPLSPLYSIFNTYNAVGKNIVLIIKMRHCHNKRTTTNAPHQLPQPLLQQMHHIHNHNKCNTTTSTTSIPHPPQQQAYPYYFYSKHITTAATTSAPQLLQMHRIHYHISATQPPQQQAYPY